MRLINHWLSTGRGASRMRAWDLEAATPSLDSTAASCWQHAESRASHPGTKL